MLSVEDVQNIEGNAETEEERYISLQRAINSGSAWRFQGFVGRAMMEAIEQGYCMLGTERARDFYGNRIPARTDVEDGTKGSRGFVSLKRGGDWADLMEGV
jgi:hypothetical protein